MATTQQRSAGEFAFDVLEKLSRRLEKLRKKAHDYADPEDIHQIRTSLRRTRAALMLFRPIVTLPKGLTDKKLAALARNFGKKRDNDVLIARFNEVSAALRNELNLVKKVKR